MTTDTIHVESLNESMIRVYSDNFGLEQELHEYFQFYAPGYRFMKLFREKMWDGKIKLYDIRRKTLPRGLFDYVKHYAEQNKYTLNINTVNGDIEPSGIHISTEDVKTFMSRLKPHSKGQQLELRSYQIESIHRAINKEKILISSPTSSGKSLVLYAIIRWLIEQNKRVLLLVPTTSLVEQMYSDFVDYSSHNGWDPSEHVHTLYSGKDKVFDKPVLISTWQTIHSMHKSKKIDHKTFFSKWEAFIGDEAHLFTAASLKQIAESLTKAKWRIGTTGTVQDEKVSKLTLEGCFGPIYTATSTAKLMKDDHVAKLRIKCMVLNYDDETKKLVKKAKYPDEMKFLVTNQKRNRFIANLALATKGNTLVLFQFVEKHGKPLYEIINKQNEASQLNKPVFYISGETNVDERELIRLGLDKYKNAIIVASVAILGTGVNIPSLENIIFASPSKSKIRNLQSIGRGLRLNKDKNSCLLIDIADNLSTGKQMNHTMKHFKERLAIYSKEEFEFSITKINI